MWWCAIKTWEFLWRGNCQMTRMETEQTMKNTCSQQRQQQAQHLVQQLVQKDAQERGRNPVHMLDSGGDMAQGVIPQHPLAQQIWGPPGRWRSRIPTGASLCGWGQGGSSLAALVCGGSSKSTGEGAGRGGQQAAWPQGWWNGEQPKLLCGYKRSLRDRQGQCWSWQRLEA